MSTTMVNIPKSIQDEKYRPLIVLVEEKAGNGKKTRVANIKELAKALGWPSIAVLGYLSKSLGVSLKNDTILAGHVTVDRAEFEIENFIKQNVLCSTCNLPELVYEIRKNMISASCTGCSGTKTIKDPSLIRNILRAPDVPSTMTIPDDVSSKTGTTTTTIEGVEKRTTAMRDLVNLLEMAEGKSDEDLKTSISFAPIQCTPIETHKCTVRATGCVIHELRDLMDMEDGKFSMTRNTLKECLIRARRNSYFMMHCIEPRQQSFEFLAAIFLAVAMHQNARSHLELAQKLIENILGIIIVTDEISIPGDDIIAFLDPDTENTRTFMLARLEWKIMVPVRVLVSGLDTFKNNLRAALEAQEGEDSEEDDEESE